MKIIILSMLLILIACKKEKTETTVETSEQSGPSAYLSIPKNPISDTPEQDADDIRKAIRAEDYQKVKQILYQNIPEEEANAQINHLVKTYGMPNVLLWSSAPIGDFEAVKIAISQGADVNIEIGGKGTPLLGATQADHLEMIKFLLKSGADPNKRGVMGATPLSIAVGKNNKELVDLLINSGASFTRGGDPGHKEFSILTVALASSNFEMMKHLLTRGANPNGGNGLPLAFAIMMKNQEAIKLLVEKGADVNFKGKAGFRPLMTAVIEGDEKIIELLLKLGADPKIVDDKGKDAFAWAEKYKSKGGEILKRLLSAKAKK